MPQKEVIDVDMLLLAETEKAILVSDTDDDKDKIWLPKSQVEFTPATSKGITTVTLPVWLAHNKKLI